MYVLRFFFVFLFSFFFFFFFLLQNAPIATVFDDAIYLFRWAREMKKKSLQQQTNNYHTSNVIMSGGTTIAAGGAVAWWLTPRTPDPEVGGSSPTRVAVLCP